MNKEKIHKFRRKLGWVVFLGGMVANVIISWGFLFMKPVFHLLFSIAAGVFSVKLLAISLLKCFFSSCGMVCIIMDDRNCHGIFGRLLMDKEKELKEHIEKRIQNYVWKVLTGKKLTIEDIGGYSSVGFKNRRW